jgi:hypothetical protein
MADLEAISEEYGNWIDEALSENLVNTWSVQQVALRAMNEAEGISFNDPTGYPKAGADGAAQAPLGSSYTVTLSTGLVGRSARGRIYGVGLSTPAIVNGNRVADAYRDGYQACWYAWLSRFDTAGYAPQVVSFVDAGVPRTEGRMLPILSVNVRFPLATQRRRLS